MCRILVAEDSFALANLLTFVLKNAGYDVDLHRSGASAYKATCAEKFDIIMLDQQMPYMTGIEVTEALRADGPNQLTPVFLCTAKSHEIGVEELMQRLNVSAVFQKPFSPKELVQHLKTVAEPAAVQ